MIGVLVQDHHEVEELFAKLEGSPLADADRGMLVSSVTAELVRHAVAEEQWLYPTARRVLDDGDDVADHEIAEHSEVEDTLKQLERAHPEAPGYRELVAKLIGDVRHHIEEEENELFPRLKGVIGEAEMTELGGKIESAKRSAPTRPHPSSPDTPPANKLLAPGAGMIDRLRDFFSGRET
jgi:hemerythrin superfamily protein